MLLNAIQLSELNFSIHVKFTVSRNTTHLQIVPRLRLRGAIPPLLRMFSWHGSCLNTRYDFVVWYFIKHGSVMPLLH